jgi:hypothetical protein
MRRRCRERVLGVVAGLIVVAAFGRFLPFILLIIRRSE